METSQLSYLIAVVEERSFTRAAERMQVAQSAVSSAIGRLERELGATLFDRGWREVNATSAGDVVYRHALTVSGCLQNIRDELAAVELGLSGSVSVGVVLSTGDLDLPATVCAFQQSHPRVEVRLVPIPGPAQTRLEPVQDGRIDLALVPVTHPVSDAVHFTPITHVQLSLACRADDELSTRTAVPVAEIADRPFIDFPRGWGNRSVTEELFAHHGLRRRIAVEVPDVYTALALVRVGAGVAFIPAEHVAAAGPDVVAVSLADEPPRIVLGIVRSSIRPATAAAQRFHDLLIASARRAQ